MKYRLPLLLTGLLLTILFAGCVSTPPGGLTKADVPGSNKEPEKIVLYQERPAAILQEVGTIRKEPLYIQLDVVMDKQLKRYVIDVHQFETIGLKTGEQVIWVCKNNIPFTVHFGWDSPFEKGVYIAQKVDDRTYMTEPAVVRKSIPISATSVPYKYFIAAYIREFDFVVTYDPRILFIPPDYDY